MREGDPVPAIEAIREWAPELWELTRWRQYTNGAFTTTILDTRLWVAPFKSIAWDDTAGANPVSYPSGAVPATVVQAYAYNGDYGTSTVTGRNLQVTLPVGTVRCGVGHTVQGNSALLAVTIDGDPTAANLLPTAQQLVDRGVAAATILVAGGGPFNPADRVLDTYHGANVTGSVGGTDSYFGHHTAICDNLDPTVAHTVRVQHSGQKNLAASGTATMTMDRFTHGSLSMHLGDSGVELLDLYRALFNIIPDSEYALAVQPSGASSSVFVGGQAHSYETTVNSAITYKLDGAALLTSGTAGNPGNLAVNAPTVLASAWNLGTTVEITRPSQLFHPTLDAGATAWANSTTTFTVTQAGLSFHPSIALLRDATFGNHYLTMYSLDGYRFTKGWRYGDEAIQTFTAGDDSTVYATSYGLVFYDPSGKQAANWELAASGDVGILDASPSLATGAPNSKIVKGYSRSPDPVTHPSGTVLSTTSLLRLALVAGSIETPPVHVRERPPLRQHIDAITPSGRHYRWGEDEPDAANVFADLRHSSTMPGGYESLEVTLPRKPGVDYSDLERLTTLRVVGAGGQVDGEYRLERAPRVSGDQMAISPSAVGWQAHLEDDKSARMVYRDIDLSRWGNSGAVRQIALLDLNWRTFAPETLTDQDGNPTVKTWNADPWASPFKPTSEAWYQSPVDLGSVYYEWQRNANVINTDANWNWGVRLDEDGSGADDDTGNLRAAGPGTGTLTAGGAGRRVAMLYMFYNLTGAGEDAREHDIFWRHLAVYGNHGLTKRGTEPDAGFYASDVVAHAVGSWAPLLQIKSDSIQQSSFVIPQLAFLEPTTAAEIVRQASRFNLPDWAVWDDREFVWHERGARGRRWRARIGPSQLEETGPQLDRLWNGIIVSYQDVDGTTRTVGPVGSGSDAESSDLSDLDPENPANKLGIRRWDVLQMGVSTAAGATEVGRRFLEQTRVLDSSGRATIVGWVEDDRGIAHPYTRVRAGDYISFTDASDRSARRIVRVDHTRSTRSCTLDLDAPPDGLSQLLERLGVVLVPLGL